MKIVYTCVNLMGCMATTFVNTEGDTLGYRVVSGSEQRILSSDGLDTGYTIGGAKDFEP